MAEKAKAKKAKTLSKKTSTPKAKKREVEDQEEVLELKAEEAPKRAPKVKAPAPAEEKPIAKAAETPKEQPPKVGIITPVVQPTNVSANKQIAPGEAPRNDSPRHDAAHQPRHDHQKKPAVENDGLRLRLSQSLVKKLKEQAADEGITLEEFVGELLAESVVLRAWEIVERKNAMKGSSGQGFGGNQRGQGNNQGGGNRNNNNNNRNNNNNNNQGGGNKGHRGMSHVRYQTIMDDKATFLEYVRSQEKMRR